jgi:predicted homoserine dehydrogenase-like protein
VNALAVSAGRIAVALVIASVLLSIGLGMLMSLVRRTPRNVPLPEAEPPPANMRITFWCEECGTEVLLLRKGSESPPRHCGEPMTRREEIARD